MMSGNSSTTHYHLTQIFDTLENQKDKNAYYRLEPEILTANTEMDNASPENLTKLNEDALNYISQREVDQQLTDIARKLIENE